MQEEEEFKLLQKKFRMNLIKSAHNLEILFASHKHFLVPLLCVCRRKCTETLLFGMYSKYLQMYSIVKIKIFIMVFLESSLSIHLFLNVQIN